MYFNVAKLMKSPVGATHDYDVAETPEWTGEDVPTLAAPIHGHFRVIRTNQGLLVTGHFDTVVELQCSRCLDSFTMPIEFELEEQYYPTIDITTGMPIPLFDSDTGFPIDSNHILDLHEAARQHSLLALPMKPICREDCKGLCPQCGQYLNQNKCACQPPVDERLSILEQLLYTDYYHSPN